MQKEKGTECAENAIAFSMFLVPERINEWVIYCATACLRRMTAVR